MSTSAADHAPDLRIRTKPPTPKRLSRRVLLAGVALAGVVIAFAVINGLSSTTPHVQAHQEAQIAATPPSSIAQASSQYEAHDLSHGMAPPVDVDANAPALAPPSDPSWSAAASSSPTTPATRSETTDPDTVAHASPLMFARADARTAAGAAVSGQAARLEAVLTPPHSRFEIHAGDIIPAALVTGLNSDVPGRVIAQVTAPVYDSVSGRYLLIPQGARLIGSYDNAVHYGDDRIVLTWDRLILPNGWSIDLGAMNGADPTGAAGIKDTTDNHLWRLGGAVGLSAIISVIAGNSEGSERSQSLSQSVGDAAAQQAAQTGSQIVSRELAVRPTLRVRPGANVRVLVTRDIELRPYEHGDDSGDSGTP